MGYSAGLMCNNCSERCRNMKSSTKLLIAAGIFVFLLVIGIIIAIILTSNAKNPPMVEFKATIRDFKSKNSDGGHPDFERDTVGDDRNAVLEDLGTDGMPQYNPAFTHQTITSKESFDAWWHDSPYNTGPISYSLPLKRTKSEVKDTYIYSFSSSSFFPIDKAGVGWPERMNGHNYHFTLHCRFPETKYRGGEKFNFRGDDDVWLFINGKLAIDLGGVHVAETSEIQLDTLARDRKWFKVGDPLVLDFFFAERHTVESNFHIDTTLKFDNIDLSWLWPWVPLALLILAAIVGLMFLMFYVKRTLEKQEALYDDEPAPEKRQWNDVVRTDRYIWGGAGGAAPLKTDFGAKGNPGEYVAQEVVQYEYMPVTNNFIKYCCCCLVKKYSTSTLAAHKVGSQRVWRSAKSPPVTREDRTVSASQSQSQFQQISAPNTPRQTASSTSSRPSPPPSPRGDTSPRAAPPAYAPPSPSRVQHAPPPETVSVPIANRWKPTNDTPARNSPQRGAPGPSPGRVANAARNWQNRV